MMVSEHFSLSEFTRSQLATRLGLDNMPGPVELDNLCRLCRCVLEPVRTRFGVPVTVTSGYRSPEVNAAARGSRDSSHMRGEAADIELFVVSNLEVAQWIRDSALDFDQLILEYHVSGEPSSGWVHVSYRGGYNRREVLTAALHAGRLRYTPGIVA